MNEELSNVINNNYCVGCGACAVVESEISMIESSKGTYIPFFSKVNKNFVNAEKVCPFSVYTSNETETANKVFETNELQNDKIVGWYSGIYIGSRKDQIRRLNSSSGGMTTWICEQLLKQNLVNGIIHVKKKVNSLEFEYSISSTVDEVRLGEKTKYYPNEFSKVLNSLKNIHGKFAFVGIPCHIKAIRNICMNDAILSEKIIFFIGIICGHLKTKQYMDHLIKFANVNSHNAHGFDFRGKIKGKVVNHYENVIETLHGNVHTGPTRYMFGGDWGVGLYKLKSCDYCDDIFNEVADVVLGDAWLNKLEKEWMGNNIVITRNKLFDNILSVGLKEQEISLCSASLDDLKQSQASSITHKTKGLAIRLKHKQQNGEWAPKKRLKTLNDIAYLPKSRYVLRENISQKSIEIGEKHINNRYYRFLIQILLMKDLMEYRLASRKSIINYLPEFIRIKIRKLLKK